MGDTVSIDRLIFISGWATDESCWRSVTRWISGSLSCGHVKWWECSNGPAKENALFRVLEGEEGGAIIVGWSLGALIALESALLRPERVKGLVLVSGTARMTSEGNYPGVDTRVLRAMRAKFSRTPRPTLEEFGTQCIGNSIESSTEADKFVKKFVNTAERLNPEHLAAGLRYLQETDLRTLLPQIKAPVHILHGDCDRVIPVECARYLEKALPNSRLDEVKGGPHALPFTAADRVAGRIKALINNNGVAL